MGELLNERCEQWDTLTAELAVVDRLIENAQAARMGIVMARLGMLHDGFNVDSLVRRGCEAV
jgi:hypothetical protein